MIKFYKLFSLLTFLLFLNAINAQQTSIDSLVKDSVFPHITYDWISYKMKVEMNKQDEKLAFQCFFVNHIDSSIYLNFNRYGVELARIVLTPDTVTFVNKLEHNFYKGNYTFFDKLLGFPLTFSMIQSLLNAVDFEDFDDHLERVEHDGKLLYISPLRKHQFLNLSLMQSIEIGEGAVIVENDMTDLGTRRNVVMIYSDYSYSEVRSFFTQLKGKIPNENIDFQAEIKNVKFNSQGPMSIRIPESFTPIFE